MGCLYQLIAPNGKSYIGITSKTAEERWNVHLMRVREGRSHALQAAIRKHGQDKFQVKTLVIADDWDYLCDLEKKAIVAYGTMVPNGYNLTSGGEGVVGRVHTEDAALRMSAGQTKRKREEWEIRRLKDIAVAYWASPEGQRRKQEARDRQEAYRAGGKQRQAAAIREALARPEVREKVLRCAAKRSATPGWREKISASKQGQGLGSKRSDETKAKQSEARRLWWEKRKQCNG